MRKNIIIFLIGTVMGSIATYLTIRNKKKIYKKLNDIEKKVERLDIKNNVRDMIEDTVDSIKFLTKKAEKAAIDEKEAIIHKVEEKIKRLEKLIK
ncbi:MAG TPA: hypothetical protein DEP48_05655 [Persephonella sp.]|uniref:YtxH domain-containing protein n=1 Tax=Persephonella marina (strain DSM 14350 / EX-H1) TaxID=123214 RepID=C0QPG2_PERMH|nr:MULTISPECIES: hypothetical protein [Persephonella]ACO04283.1 conserved hypothetical protein [Persephonella marina EX-H1]HCB69827.1 hypothetical protein [Persephonella sp.]